MKTSIRLSVSVFILPPPLTCAEQRMHQPKGGGESGTEQLVHQLPLMNPLRDRATCASAPIGEVCGCLRVGTEQLVHQLP